MTMQDEPLFTTQRIAVMICAVAAIAVPAFLLRDWQKPADPEPPIIVSNFAFASTEEAADALAAPLFNADRTAPDPDADNASDVDTGTVATASSQPLALVGVIIGGRSRAMALVRAGDGQTSVTHVGDTVDGWQVSTISAAGVSLSKSGQQQKLTLEYGNKAEPSKEAGSTASSQSAGGAIQ